MSITKKSIEHGIFQGPLNFTEFGKNAPALFSSVEGGEIIQVLKHGKKIVEILPVRDKK